MVTPPLDPSHLALDPVDMDLDLDLGMAVLVVCMDPTWEHCSHMVSGVEVHSVLDDIEVISNFFRRNHPKILL